jgi:hypothetical protein
MLPEFTRLRLSHGSPELPLSSVVIFQLTQYDRAQLLIDEDHRIVRVYGTVRPLEGSETCIVRALRRPALLPVIGSFLTGVAGEDWCIEARKFFWGELAQDALLDWSVSRGEKDVSINEQPRSGYEQIRSAAQLWK